MTQRAQPARRPAEARRPQETRRPHKAAASGPALRLIPLGGMGEIGKNLYLYEYQDTIILVDCGLALPDETTLGVDIIIPDITYLRERKSAVKVKQLQRIYLKWQPLRFQLFVLLLAKEPAAVHWELVLAIKYS